MASYLTDPHSRPLLEFDLPNRVVKVVLLGSLCSSNLADELPASEFQCQRPGLAAMLLSCDEISDLHG